MTLRQARQSALKAFIPIALFLLGAPAHPCFGQVQTPRSVDEYRLKAEYLFHFAQLIEWPPASEQDPLSIVVCTYANDPFHGALEQIAGRQIQNRVLRVRHLSKEADPRVCNILFIDEEHSHISGIVAKLKGAPVATVGEGDDFIAQGGTIRFCWDRKRIRFQINLRAAESAKLKISSRLLLLAKDVFGKDARARAGD